jgi:hypothetical protein
MNEKPKDYYRVLAPGVPNYPDVSERFASEADARRAEVGNSNGLSNGNRAHRKDESGRAK